LTIESAFSVIRMCQKVNGYGGICDDYFYLHYMTREWCKNTAEIPPRQYNWLFEWAWGGNV